MVLGKGLFWSCWPFSGGITLTIDQASLDRSLSSSMSLSSTYSISTSEFCTRNSCPCILTMVHFFSFCLFFSTSPRSLQVSTPLFLTKTWHSSSMQIMNHFSTSFSIIYSLVWRSHQSVASVASATDNRIHKSLLRSWTGLNFSKLLNVLKLTCHFSGSQSGFSRSMPWRGMDAGDWCRMAWDISMTPENRLVLSHIDEVNLQQDSE